MWTEIVCFAHFRTWPSVTRGIFLPSCHVTFSVGLLAGDRDHFFGGERSKLHHTISRMCIVYIYTHYCNVVEYVIIFILYHMNDICIYIYTYAIMYMVYKYTMLPNNTI